MANTTERHKQKKSQKRKDRQERRRQKQLSKIAEEADNVGDVRQDGRVVQEGELPKKKKSIPGLLAKNCDNIMRWLRDYLLMFMKCDDEGSEYIRKMPIEQHRQLIQDYVDIRLMIREIEDIRNPGKTA